MKTKLGFVSENSDGLRIISSGEYGYMLGYRDNNGKDVLVAGDTDNRRPIYLSELKTKLTSRSWNSPLSRYVENGNLMIDVTETSGPIKKVEEADGVLASNTGGIDENQVLVTLSNIISDMEKSSVYLYNVSKSVIDLLKNTVTYNIVNYGSDVYTNTVSLGDISKNLVYPGSTGKVELSIQYSKEDKIFNHDTTFEAFKFEENSNNIKTSPFIEKVRDDVAIEFSDNIIRVVPINSRIGECIISNCSLTYGKI